MIVLKERFPTTVGIMLMLKIHAKDNETDRKSISTPFTTSIHQSFDSSQLAGSVPLFHPLTSPHHCQIAGPPWGASIYDHLVGRPLLFLFSRRTIAPFHSLCLCILSARYSSRVESFEGINLPFARKPSSSLMSICGTAIGE